MRHLRFAFALILALLAAPALFSESSDVRSWFRDEPRAHSYSAVEADVLRVFDDAGKAGLPLGPLMDKLQEGASKGAAANVLLTALRAESQRLSMGQAILDTQGVRFIDPGDREEALRAISLLVVDGVSAQTIESLLALAVSVGRDPLDDAEALRVLAQVKLSSRLADNDIQRLGAALLKSRLPRAAFNSIPPFLLKASALGMSDQAIEDIIVSVLGSGGSLIQMEEEIQKRKGLASPSSPPVRSGSPGGSAVGGSAGGASAGTSNRPAGGSPGAGPAGHRQQR